MATEKVEIFNVDTGEAVKSIADLKDNIKLLKKALEEQTIGTEEYQQTLQELKVNQNALKDAMHATSASMEDVAASAKGINVVFDENNQLINQENQSYNALVHTMAELKQEWRATTDEVKRAELGEQINQINDRLKEMDASVGNFQRNVGNYGSVWKDSGDALKKLSPAFGSMTNKIEGTNKAMKLMSTNPLMGVMVLLLPLVQKLAEALKDNEKAGANVKKMMDALKPVTQFFSNILDVIAGWLGKVVDWVVGWFPKFAPIFSKVVTSITGVGNAILQYLLTPVRTAIEAFKGLGNIIKDVFTGNFDKVKEDAKNAMDGITEAVKKGFSFKANFIAGQSAGDGLMSGLESATTGSSTGGGGKGTPAYDLGAEVAKNIAKGMAEIDKYIESISDEIVDVTEDAEDLMKEYLDTTANYAKARIAVMDKAAKDELSWNNILTDDADEKARKAYEIQSKLNHDKLDLLRQFADEALSNGDGARLLEYQQQIADLELQIAQNEAIEESRIRKQTEAEEEQALARKKARTQQAISELQSLAGATASILGTIASAYESDEANAEKNAKKVKALRISEALINTISGAVGAFTQASSSIPPPMGQIIGALSAAAVTASGMAQIAQIRKTQIGSGSASAAPLSVSAPAISSMPQNVRNVTSQSEEDRLNRMAQDQRVVLVQSDIQVSNEQTRVQIVESTF